MRASDPRPAPVPTKRRRLRTHGMDEAGGIRLPAGADAPAAAEEAPSPPASAPSPEAVLIAAAVVDRGLGCERVGEHGVVSGTRLWPEQGGPTRSGLGWALFSSKFFCKIDTVAFSFVFDKYCPIID